MDFNNYYYQFYAQKLMFDFKCLQSNMEIGSDDDYTPANEWLASLLNEDYQLCEQDTQ